MQQGDLEQAIRYSRSNLTELEQDLGTQAATGLSDDEAAIRLKQYGPNQIGKTDRLNGIVALLVHFKNPLVIILIVATTVSYIMGDVVNASIIFAMVLASVGLDYFQERHATNAAAKLKAQVSNRIQVIRHGEEHEMTPEDLVPGDIIFLNAGKVTPADARLIQTNELFVSQSSLTGESMPAQKTGDTLPSTNGGDIEDLTNILWMGSNIISGSGRAMVFQTGAGTMFGNIAKSLVSREEENDFSRGIKDFGYLIMRVTLILVICIFFVNAFSKHNVLESFMFSLAVAVGLTPELLPMIMSVTMSLGSVRMAAKGVIVKKLTAIPNFGSMDVLCTDKTGTITEDKIELVKAVDLTGKENDAVKTLAWLNSNFQTATKNPLDDALLKACVSPAGQYTKIDELPFDFERKRLSVIVNNGSSYQLICKGAPEEILNVCSGNMDAANLLYEQLSKDGLRLLGIAQKIVSEVRDKYAISDESALEFAGFLCFMDPPKADVGKVIKDLAEIGVEVKIITGDNQFITQKVCTDIGLEVKSIMLGHELQDLSDDALLIRARETTIFARFAPAQKNRIIRVLKKSHHSVGYMGDGINDAPSLRAADVGISVNTATDVAKDAASIILTQKDLLVLKEGILEGRKTFANTMKYILMGISSNFGNMFSVAAATLFLPFLPMLPLQILVNNFLYDFSQLTIPTDNIDSSASLRPQHWNLKVIQVYMVVFGITSSVFDFITFYILKNVYHVSPSQFQTGWFMESLGTQILVVFIIRTRHIPFVQSLPSRGLALSTLSCLAIGWWLPYSPLASYLKFAPLPGNILLAIGALVFIYLVCAEGVKQLIYQKYILKLAK